MRRPTPFALVLAAVLAAPALALGAPPGGQAVVRATPVSRESPTRGAAAERSTQDQFKVPFDVDLRPAQLPEAAQYRLDPYQPRAWEAPGYVLYQPACPSGGLLGPSVGLTAPAGVASPPQDFTIGSLVDQRSENLFSSTPSYTNGSTGLANLGSAGAAASSPLTFQYGLASTPCGMPIIP